MQAEIVKGYSPADMEAPDTRRKQISEFFREEFLRHKDRLEHQRSFFGVETYSEIESVLNRIIEEMERICETDNF
ncbi:MAG TPA: hypothetical protein VFY29_07925, partial [Terriglobia bacterium]|nr:hypothetical protein [Terriglobia bacterium]